MGVHKVDILWMKCINDFSRSAAVLKKLKINVAFMSARVADKFEKLL